MFCSLWTAAGRGTGVKHSRVEYIAATTSSGLTNSRDDGTTFTTSWCNAFTGHLEQGKAFDTQDIVETVNLDPKIIKVLEKLAENETFVNVYRRNPFLCLEIKLFIV
jgi:hypothetical protein